MCHVAPSNMLDFFLSTSFFKVDEKFKHEKSTTKQWIFNIPTIPESLTGFCWYLLQVPSSSSGPKNALSVRRLKLCISVSINTLNLPLSGRNRAFENSDNQSTLLKLLQRLRFLTVCTYISQHLKLLSLAFFVKEKGTEKNSVIAM